MYFILSKVLLCLIYPFTWVCVLLALAIFAKNKPRRRKYLIAAVVVLYVFSNAGLSITVTHAWDVNQQPDPNRKFSTAIVLGGFSGEDDKGNGRFNWAADRFIQGLRLYNTRVVSHVLITSGNGNLNPSGYREATWAKGQMRQMNVPDSALLIESNSKNTIENAKFSLVLLNQRRIKGPYLLVTSAFHMRRSLMIFKKEKIDVAPCTANIIGSDRLQFDDWFIPSSEALSHWNLYLKEMVGYVVNSFNG